MSKIKRALISVYDKSGIVDLAKALVSQGVEIISSGGTAKHLSENNIDTIAVEDITKFPEMLDGRVKTMHPAIHAGILARRDSSEHMDTLNAHNLNEINLVVVNLYPFEKIAANTDSSNEDLIENIDIGGPTLIRSAAKNYKDVVILTNPSQYEGFIEGIASEITEEQRSEYAIAAFERTAQYDQIIQATLSQRLKSSSDESHSNLSLKSRQTLRYGENPHQLAKLYSITNPEHNLYQGINGIVQLSGKELSYNNWLDMDAAISLISEFEEEIPTCAIIKHNIPCGVALGETVEEAFQYALDSDPVSAFGGIVCFNQTVNKETAKKLADMFLEVIIAPDCDGDAMDILREKKNLRLIKAKPFGQDNNFWHYKSILGNGLLVQNYDASLLNNEDLKTVTEIEPNKEDWVSLLFAFRVAKHVKSNGIVLVNGNRTVGICGGQTNRVNAVRIALEEASDLASDAIIASDGFFPFADSVDLLAQSRIKAIIQPGGSIRDNDVIAAANKYKIPMVFSGQRHFKH